LRSVGSGQVALLLALTLVVVPIATAGSSAAAPTSLPRYVGDFLGPALAGMYPVDAASSATDYYVLDAGRYRIV